MFDQQYLILTKRTFFNFVCKSNYTLNRPKCKLYQHTLWVFGIYFVFSADAVVGLLDSGLVFSYRIST